MSEPTLVSLSCNSCGAPLQIRPGTRFVTCARCGCQLQVHEEASAIFTEAMEQLRDQTEAMAAELHQIKLRQELDACDRAWAKEQEELCIRSKQGELVTPSVGQAWLSLTLWVAGGLVFSIYSLASQGLVAISFVGFGIAIIGFIIGLGRLGLASRYAAAESAYLRQRDTLVRQLSPEG